MNQVAILKNSERAHADYMESLLLALREGVRLGVFHHTGIESTLIHASQRDSAQVRRMLEVTLRSLRNH